MAQLAAPSFCLRIAHPGPELPSEDAQVSAIILRVTRTLRCLLSLALLACSSHFVAAQTRPSSKPTTDSLLPGPEPPDAPLEWKRHVGIYEYSSYNSSSQTVIILERNQRLYIQYPSHKEEQVGLKDGFLFVPELDGRGWGYQLHEEDGGAVSYFSYLMEAFARTDAGADASRAYRVNPAQPVAGLREKALKLQPLVEVGAFRKPDLVELAMLDPAIHLDIRYASTNNFLSTPVYPEARAFMQRPAAEALVRVLHKLQPLGYGLLIHDAYRPWYVTKIFWDATPAEGKIFVADPRKGSKHNRGCAVDLTLYDLATGQPIEMPGLYDEMSPRSFPNFPGGTSLQRWHRDLLRRAMESEGFTVNEDEWWHFDYKEWKQYGIMNVAFESLAVSR